MLLSNGCFPAVPIPKSNRQQQDVLVDYHQQCILASAQVTQGTCEYGGSELETSEALAAVRKGLFTFQNDMNLPVMRSGL